MLSINLSGLQSLEIPPSLFDEFFEKNSHFGASKYPEGNAVMVDVLHDKHNKYQSEKEPAIGVYLENCLIGYIPVLSTIEKYINQLARQMGQAMSDMDADEHNRLRKQYDKQNERYDYTSVIRDYVQTDLFINKLPVKGQLSRVQVADDTGKVLSVSVAFDIM